VGFAGIEPGVRVMVHRLPRGAYPMVVGSRLPDQASASIQTTTSVAVNPTNGTRRGSMAPSAR